VFGPVWRIEPLPAAGKGQVEYTSRTCGISLFYADVWPGGFMFEGLFQPMHLLVIFFIALLVFGPRKLPELGKGLGDGIRALKEGMKDHTEAKAEAAPEVKAEVKPEVKAEVKPENKV
jgi:sec-independent protein translocase protein TatA